MWHQRLDRTPFFLEAWLRHQRRDEFWQQGSICEDFAAVQTPILLVGGWADGYTNAVGRTLAGLTAAGVPCRALIGPWSHGWPEVAEPGPRIGFLQECVRWLDHWLQGVDNGVMDAPLLRAWMQEYAAPAAHHSVRPGRWVAESAWPSARMASLTLKPGADATLAPQPGPATVEEHVTSVLSGADGGAWCPYGEVTDFPPDQRAEDGLAMSFTTEPLSERLEVLGVPTLTLECSVDQPLALVAVRLCDVAPGGESLLVARGLLNLSHRHSHTEPTPMPVDEPTTVHLGLDLCGHAFAAGHRIRLAVTSGYWPFAWPSPEPVRLAVRLGEATQLELPVRTADPADERLRPFGPAERTAPAAGEVRHVPWRSATRDLGSGRVGLEVGAEEHCRLDQERLEFGERVNRRFEIYEDEPLSARVECEGEHFLRRGAWRIVVRLAHLDVRHGRGIPGQQGPGRVRGQPLRPQFAHHRVDPTRPRMSGLAGALFPFLANDPPGRAAISFPDRSLSYLELRDASARVAESLAGVSRAAVLAESRIETCVAVIGALTAGVPVVPVNPKSGTRELRHILADAAPDVLLSGPGAAVPGGLGGAPAADRRTRRSRSGGRRSDRPVVARARRTGADRVHVGDHGTAQGSGAAAPRAGVEFDALADAWDWSDRGRRRPRAAAVSCARPGDRHPRPGATRRHRRAPGRFSAEGIGDALKDGATMLFGVPTMYRRLADAAQESPGLAEALGGARLLVSGSAALPASEHARLQRSPAAAWWSATG